jgi:adhesin transport system outer membrane protein
MQWDLYNGGKNYARRDASRWRHQESLQLKESTERDVVTQVYQTWSAYTYLDQQVEFLKSNVDNSAIAEQGYREQFRVGRRELLDVLIAKTDLFQARKSYLETQSRHLAATYRLKRIVGQLMPALSINFPEEWKEAE